MRAGQIHEVCRDSGEWLFVDVGFSRDAATCGMLNGAGSPREVSFGDLVDAVTAECATSGDPLNLLLEAPLSVAFTADGHPSGRSVERRDGEQPRYWYLGGGCAVMVATMYLLRAVADRGTSREVRLFEGFVSFKKKGGRSSHAQDVERLREVAWNPATHPGAILGPGDLLLHKGDALRSAFAVLGLNLGVPPVVVGEG